MALTYLEKIEQRLQDEGIILDYFPFETIDAMAIKKGQFSKKDHICINKSKHYTSVEKRMLLEHEYSHILTDSFYTFENKKSAVKRKETKANDNMIERLDLAHKAISLWQQGYRDWEVAEALDITYQFVDCIKNYIKRKRRD